MEAPGPSSEATALLPVTESADAGFSFHLALAFKLSWVVNWLLLGLKVYAFVVSRSKAVLASMADSAGMVGSVVHGHVSIREHTCGGSVVMKAQLARLGFGRSYRQGISCTPARAASRAQELPEYISAHTTSRPSHTNHSDIHTYYPAFLCPQWT